MTMQEAQDCIRVGAKGFEKIDMWQKVIREATPKPRAMSDDELRAMAEVKAWMNRPPETLLPQVKLAAVLCG